MRTWPPEILLTRKRAGSAAGSPQFNRLKDSIVRIPTSQGGTLFQDRSKLYNAEFQYNLSHFIKVLDVIAGLNLPPLPVGFKKARCSPYA